VSVTVRCLWDLWWIKWQWGNFCPSTSVFPRQYHPPLLHTHLHQHAALTGSTNGRNLGTCDKQRCFKGRAAVDRKFRDLVLGASRRRRRYACVLKTAEI
jgi:hypothetical protein